MLVFLGGTGPEGRGLALRYALAGEAVIIGSRDRGRAEEVAKKLKQMAPDANIAGAENADAARRGAPVFLVVPYEAQKSLLSQLEEVLAEKVLISVIAPLAFEKGRARAIVVEEGSAAEQSQKLLPRSKVVAAFQNLSAVELLAPERTMEGDVVVCSDHPEAKKQVMAMVGRIGSLRAIDGGTLENARYVEEMTALLLNINRIYRAHSSIKIVGV